MGTTPKNNADFRVIVTSGFVMSHKHANELRSSINAGGTLTKIKGTSIGVKASADSKASVIISDNTIVAYQFARPCWDNEANLRALAIDKKGIDESECPNGTTSKHPKRLK